MPNKTPLSILFEYASRLNLQVCPSLMIDEMCPKSLSSFLPPLGRCMCRSLLCQCGRLHQVHHSGKLAWVVKQWWGACSSRSRRDRHRKATSR